MSTKKIFIFLIISIFLSNVTACAQQKVKNGAYNTMLKILLKHNVTEISALVAHQNFNDYVFLDSRERNEFEVSHIKNAIWIGYNDFDVSRIKLISKNKKIIIYCSVGARSENISNKLINNGFTSVSNMYGGIFEWVNEGFQVYNQQNKPTNRVHAYNKTWGIWLKRGEKVY